MAVNPIFKESIFFSPKNGAIPCFSMDLYHQNKDPNPGEIEEPRATKLRSPGFQGSRRDLGCPRCPNPARSKRRRSESHTPAVICPPHIFFKLFNPVESSTPLFDNGQSRSLLCPLVQEIPVDPNDWKEGVSSGVVQLQGDQGVPCRKSFWQECY